MSIKSPVTLYLINNGTNLKEYAKKNGLDYNILNQTVNFQRRDKRCIEQLKKDDLWHLMEKEANHDQTGASL